MRTTSIPYVDEWVKICGRRLLDAAEPHGSPEVSRRSPGSVRQEAPE